ncbi:Cell wall assembly regulator [Lithohypha guttulata]|uniref:Cell wall assembly regulator n=1 Tax=Lithohypha guttulata TaxID=1690604 RepID=A0AAN7SW07_9EURO|nr:Cell wall assembly regulator [Lithohypha guttulata]KAK5083024.1 Cell wall assembly regulator [Lithohypha guttulata]KAK5098778.1 Cell wall assembly regulator [Lithohypha guttulata]
MANPIADAFRSFWHSMTSNDRHATHNSPYRTGQHVPISQSRHAPLSSIATSALESHPDVSTPYHDESKRPSISSASFAQSPSRPYSPGMRSMSSPKVPNVDEVASPGEIQMQSFADGAPPPPPPSHSWKKIDRWAEANYEELFDNLCEGCSHNDVNELEHELDVTLPQDVRESLAIHDGQERGGRPTGILLGCMLLDCEEIVQEWQNWKVVNEEYLAGVRRSQQPIYPIKGLSNGASSSSSAYHQQQNGKAWREELLARQDSQPPKAVQKAYAHPAWIPLARDWGGNNIAVDLAPGPTGKWGQVILFGRDYDCKYVIAKSWAHFLATVADDITSSKVVVDDESGEMKLKEFRTENVEPAYMDILRWRADQRYGRRGSATGRRKSQGPPGLNTNVANVNGRGSPYGSPTLEERGRSPHRFARTASGSPRHGMSSPLARVQEEIAHPQPVRPGGDTVRDFANVIESRRADKLVDAPTPIDANSSSNKLVDAPTPVSTTAEKRDFPKSSLSRVSTADDLSPTSSNAHSKANGNVKGLGVNGIEDDMKTVAI